MGNNYTILIIEDEEDLILTLSDRLESEGYTVNSASNGILGEQKAKENSYDCIILDVMMPGRDGFQVCQNLRNYGITTPVIMLTARTTNIDTVMGLRLGADDYVTKPYDFQILLARVQAAIRRSGIDQEKEKNETQEEFHFGQFTLNTNTYQLKKGDNVIPLNAQEYKLLEFLIKNPDRIINRTEILNAVWGYDSVTTTRTVDVHISWLRNKLDEKEVQKHLITVRGFGYKFIKCT